jgi:hypothetical protein
VQVEAEGLVAVVEEMLIVKSQLEGTVHLIRV